MYMKSPYASRSQKEMEDVVMNPRVSGPDNHYYMIRGGSEKGNITVWESGTIDGEYIKTYGHYHVGKLDETYTILSGEGIIILQERDGSDDVLKSFKAIKVKQGDKVFIPSGIGHLGINTGKTWLVTHDDSPVNLDEKNAISFPGHADYEPFKRLRGAGYYVVEKDNKIEFIKNPNYKKLPEVELINF